MPTNDINAAIQFAVNICNDETHGYRTGGTLNPDTDCSGLVYYALQYGGFDVPSYRWYTGTMMDYLRILGFTEYIFNPGHYSDYTPQHGDICVHREGTPDDGHGHALFYAENVLGYVDKYTPTKQTLPYARVEALSTHGHPEAGDQANDYGVHNEVWVNQNNPLYSDYVWHVFRWGGAPGPTPPPQPVTELEAASALIPFICRRKRRKFL